MTSILDQVAGKLPSTSFQPATVPELFALRLAQKLGEPEAAAHYAELVREYGEETLVFAYRRSVERADVRLSSGRRFHQALASLNGRQIRPFASRLLAIKIERRLIAVAVFVGGKLDFHDMRHLSSQSDKAEASAIGFLNWILSSFDVESATLERMTNGSEIRRAVLNQAVLTTLRAAGIPVWEVSKKELLEGYGYPALRSRGELRESAHRILWSPFSTDTPNCQEIDAAAVGLHVRTERLFLL